MLKTLFKHLFIILISFSIVLMPATLCFSGNVYAQDIEYDFSDEAQKIFDASLEESENKEVQKTNIEKTVEQPKKQKEEKKKKQTKIKMIKVKKGTDFDIALQTSINSSNLNENDTIAASLEEDIVFKSNLIAPRGSIIYGKVIKVKPATGFYGKGYIQITFDEIMLPNGEIIAFSGNIIKIKGKGNRAIRIGCDILFGMLAGALAGAEEIPVLIPLGVLFGIIDGTQEAANAKGTEVEIPAGTALTIRLIKPVKTYAYIV